MPYTGVRTYYSRIYEGKFISGAIAGGSDNFMSKGKAGKMDQLLGKLTVVMCVVFFVVILVLYCLVAA